MLLSGTIAFILSTLLATLSVSQIIRWAHSRGFLDHPDDARKVHSQAVPRLGGVGIVGSLTITILLTAEPNRQITGILLGALIVAGTGLLDDLVCLRPRTKFLGQILGCIATVVSGGIYLKGFGDILGFGPVTFGAAIGIPLTVVAIVGMVNAINFIDGLDGLASGISIIACIGLGYLAFRSGNMTVLLYASALAGALLGFFRHNRYPATIFMGDAGSLTVGFILGFLAVALTQPPHGSIPPVTGLIILGLPVGDTIWVMTRRMLQRSSPFRADRGHLHHKFLDLGANHPVAVRFMWLWSLLLILFALASSMLPEWILFYAYTGGSICIYSLISFKIKS